MKQHSNICFVFQPSPASELALADLETVEQVLEAVEQAHATDDAAVVSAAQSTTAAFVLTAQSIAINLSSMPTNLPSRIFRVQAMSGLTAREFDRLANVPSGTLSLLRFRLKKDPSAGLGLTALLAYARAYALPLDWLLLGKGREPQEPAIRRRAKMIATTINTVNTTQAVTT